MKKVIGIIYRKSLSEKGHKISYIYDDINKAIRKSGGIPIGIDNNIMDYLDICDGFILQGGDDILQEDIEIIDLLYKKDIPLLGICLGMQEMAYYLGGELVDIDNHYEIYHDVKIKEDSLLYKIIGDNKINVNSRHKSSIMNYSGYINAVSEDNIIEGIEDRDKKFFLGIQWHPENMIDSDNYSQKIFDYFVKICH